MVATSCSILPATCDYGRRAIPHGSERRGLSHRRLSFLPNAWNMPFVPTRPSHVIQRLVISPRIAFASRTYTILESAVGIAAFSIKDLHRRQRRERRMFQSLIHSPVAKEASWQRQATREAPPLTSLPSVKIIRIHSSPCGPRIFSPPRNPSPIPRGKAFHATNPSSGLRTPFPLPIFAAWA